MTRIATDRPYQNGLLLIDKPTGCTSHDVVMRARRLLRQKKIGHCGTLDPDATGLLLLTCGRATRLTRFLIKAPKVYEGSIRLGMTTDTYDLAGEVVSEQAVEGVDDDRLRATTDSFIGAYMQTPPPYCAKKVGGVKYYELARRGEAVPDDKKEVTIYDFRVTAPYRPDTDLPFRLSCSSGTYARSLAHEVGQLLGCGGTLASLRRTKVGTLFDVEEAATIEELTERLEDENPDLGSTWIPFDDIPLPFAEVIADPQQERRIEHGQTVLVRDLDGQEGDWVKLVNHRQRFIAVGSVVERIGTGAVGIVQPKVVFR
ncbi:MAG: tRNA pseudouridine(55) synthase TruB [Acidobacteriota bacterium]